MSSSYLKWNENTNIICSTTPLSLKYSYSLVNLMSLLIIVFCLFKYGLYYLIHRPSRVLRCISFFVVVPGMLTSSRVIRSSQMFKCAYTGLFLRWDAPQINLLANLADINTLQCSVEIELDCKQVDLWETSKMAL